MAVSSSTISRRYMFLLAQSGQADGERAPHAGTAVDADAAAVRTDDVAHDGQADARAAHGGHARISPPVEALEDAPLIGGADAEVGDGDGDVPVVAASLDPHAAALARVAD